MHSICVQVAARGKSRQEIPPLAEELLAFDSSVFFNDEVGWAHNRTGPSPETSWEKQTGLHGEEGKKGINLNTG